MKTLVLSFTLLFITFSAYAQNISSTLEIKPYFRYDKYPKFRFDDNSIAAKDISIQGKSYGVSIAYGHGISDNLRVKFALGYYRLSFNKIDAEGRFGDAGARVINYPSPLFIPFSTNKYWYNTVSVSAGIEKIFSLKNGFSLSGGMNITDSYSFSQYYRIKQDYPTGPPDNKYMRYKKRNVSATLDLQMGINKRLGKRIELSPVINLPVFSIWALDDAFYEGNNPENNALYKSKWLMAYGVGLQFIYLLHP
ncbi:hypothetical protein DC498_14400 [Terrimonas sp.]|uniref:hypothetical protein n=1 Tax=Terrimonas sp. TaxID=1914338 RepID=UPI000D518581|nr:hypothetical protein [Terrimonas sp.]PVD51607.1 hypothetical protein DC498_14400 [Terrimonas sp.]